MFLEGHANLVEIDLLRGGQRMAMKGDWPDSPCYVLIMRKDAAPHCKILPCHFREPLPTIPIPLAAPDADVPLALQPTVTAVYDRSRYARDLDYTRTVRPTLSKADAGWIAERIGSWQA